MHAALNVHGYGWGMCNAEGKQAGCAAMIWWRLCVQILETLRLTSLGKPALPSKASVSGIMTPTKPPGLPKTDSIPLAPKSPGPFSFIKKSDSLQSSHSVDATQVSSRTVSSMWQNASDVLGAC